MTAGSLGLQIINGPTPKGGFTGGTDNPVTMWPNKGVHFAEAPRCLVVINGAILSVMNVSSVVNAYGVLDTVEFEVPIQGNVDFTQSLFQNETDTSAIPIYIYAGYPSNPSGNVTIAQLTCIFTGQLDNYVIDHAKGTVKFSGRNFGVALTDKRITTPIQYQTSVQLIQAQCALVGLGTNIIIDGPPVQMATVFTREFIAGIKNFRVWDLITQCTQFDDTDVWVDGNTLWYVSPYLVPRNTLNLAVGTDLTNLEATHSVQYNRKIRVEVRTYTPRTTQSTMTRVQTRADGSVVTATISKTGTSTPIFGTTGVNYTTYSFNDTTGAYTKASGTSYKTGGGFSTTTTPEANSGLERYTIYPRTPLTPQQCDDLARKEWRRISMHEWSVKISMPMRKDLFGQILRTTLINITNSPYGAVNQLYWPRRITWNFSLTEGATYEIECVNHQQALGQV